jgi:hypothetical protein
MNVKPPASNAFRDVPRTARGHFHLSFYAAVYRLVNHVRRLSELEGTALEEVLEEYPFLAGYFVEMLHHMPDGITWDGALRWWEREITTWEEASGVHLPLVALTEQSAVGFRGRVALMILGLVEEDSRFGTLFARLQEPLAYRRPCLELVGQMMLEEAHYERGDASATSRQRHSGSASEPHYEQGDARGTGRRRHSGSASEPHYEQGDARGTGRRRHSGFASEPHYEQGDAWAICQPLVASGLVEVVNRDAPRSEWLLRVPDMLWDVMRGDVASQPARWCAHRPPQTLPAVDSLLFPEAFLERLGQVPALVMAGKAEAIVLRGTLGSDRLHVMGALARAMGRGLVEVGDPTQLAEHGATPVPSVAHYKLNRDGLGPFCAMTRSLPVLTYDLAPGETVRVPRLTGYRGPVGILMGSAGGLHGAVMERAVTLTLPSLTVPYRLRHWQDALGDHPAQHLSEIAERFHLPGSYIRQAAAIAVAQAALDRRTMVDIGDVRKACRALNRQVLDTLAMRLEVEGSWDRLVVSEATASKLRELEQRCRHRERLLDHLAPAFGSNSNRGVRALFTGTSGTGKTLAAKILAAELGMDLYRVDLAAVINKYIGETEKNLHRVLSRAEELDVILLLDEGDALLGTRTEVKSANDRYANLETNYLLQRLETYQGIVVVTTNAGENIDKAFQRRMDIVISFVSPQAQQRWHIWQLHLPDHHAVDPAYLEDVAVRCAITGGQIRNAALHATLLAVDEGHGTVGRWHLERAIRSEYRKAGATCPLNGMDGNGRASSRNGSMEAFLTTLSR